MFRRLLGRPQVRRGIQACIVAFLLCAVGIGSVGVPVIRLAKKDRSLPFPCQDRPCGCQDAASCWKKCCCHTDTQKLAWAKKHGVTPPSFVIAAAAREAGKSAPGGCCQTVKKSVTPQCCAKQSAPPSPPTVAGCCSTKKSAPVKDTPPPAEVAVEVGIDFAVASIQAYRKCRGLPSLWLVLSQACECRIEPIMISPPIAAAKRTALLSERGEVHHTSPESPPPCVVCG